MKLTELFEQGGWQYMLLISIWGIAMLAFTIRKVIHYFVQGLFIKNGLDLILLFGSLSIITGVLAQAIGMFQAFNAIEIAGDISPSLLISGLKISMISPLYGAFIFILSLISWGILREKFIKSQSN